MIERCSCSVCLLTALWPETHLPFQSSSVLIVNIPPPRPEFNPSPSSSRPGEIFGLWSLRSTTCSVSDTRSLLGFKRRRTSISARWLMSRLVAQHCPGRRLYLAWKRWLYPAICFFCWGCSTRPAWGGGRVYILSAHTSMCATWSSLFRLVVTVTLDP